MRSFLRLWSVALLAVTVLSGACAKETGEPLEGGAAPGPRQAVDAMLRERAKALTTGNVDGYLGPMSPEARAVEEPIARGTTSVPLAEVSLLMDEADFNDAGTAVSAARIDFIYRYKDLPEDNLFRFRLLYDLEERDGSWMVTGARHDERLGELPVWARGPVTVTSSPHFLALHRPDTKRVEESLELAEGARAKLTARLTLRADDRHLLLLARDSAEYDDMAGAPLGGSVAATSYLIRSTAGHPARAESRQMIVNLTAALGDPNKKTDLPPDHGSKGGPQSGGNDDEESGPEIPKALLDKLEAELVPAQVFQHELAHLALSRFSRQSTNGWVKEGGAMLLADERRVGSWGVGELSKIYDDISFVNLTGPNLRNGILYAYANAAVFYLVETFGERKFWDFYRDFKEYEPTGSMEAHPLEELRADATHRLLRRIYDMNEEQLDEKTREYIKKANSAG